MLAPVILKFMAVTIAMMVALDVLLAIAIAIYFWRSAAPHDHSGAP